MTGQAVLPELDLLFAATGQKVLKWVRLLGRLCHADARAARGRQAELALDLVHLRQAFVGHRQERVLDDVVVRCLHHVAAVSVGMTVRTDFISGCVSENSTE